MSLLTLFWFGSEVYAYAEGELAAIPLPDKGDPAVALGEYVCGVQPRPKSVQLVYQPAGLDPIRASCTRGARAVLAKTLAREFPAIANPSTAWATLTPHAFEGAYTTLLFMETRPRIPRLASILQEQRISLRGAWPLPAVLETIPPFNTPEHPGIFLVTTETTALVYALMPNASRSVTFVNDIAAPSTALLALNTALTYFDRDNPPPVHVISLGEPWPLGEQFAHITPTVHDLPSLLQRVDSIPARGPANFSPPDTTLPWNRLLQLASLFTVLFAAATATIYYRDLTALQADLTRRAAIAEDERQQVITLRANRDAIYNATAFATEVPAGHRGISRLLEVLVKSTPAAITVHNLSVTEGTFTLEGTIHEGTGVQKGPFADFYASLSRKELPWTLSEQNRTAPNTAGFTISGTFRDVSSP
jgi:hypothetical protein